VVFTELAPSRKLWRENDKKSSVVASWYDSRGRRLLMIRQVARDRYDLRITVDAVIRAERIAIPAKQVILAARTLGVYLSQEYIERLTNIPAAAS
jgi:hypothetical protein